MVTFVDYGFFSGLPAWVFNGRPLFESAIRGQSSQQPGQTFDQGSALRLFGVTGMCTPTLIFGKVKRRYIRTFALFFSEAERVYPMRLMGQPEFDNTFLATELPPWINAKSQITNQTQLISDLQSKFRHTDYLNGNRSLSPSLCRLYPMFRDWEPYMSALKNIAKPRDPGGAWPAQTVAAPYIGDQPNIATKRDFHTCVRNFRFNNDTLLGYTGDIEALRPKKEYLRDKATYYITEGTPGSFLKLSQCKFFMDRYVTKSGGKNVLFLNQIIGFEHDIEIDLPLEVGKGGIIFSDKKIRISAPITNGCWRNPPSHADNFGLVTFISPERIEISVSGAGSLGMPEVHGFFICMNTSNSGEVETQMPTHIIGGVAADKIEKLVEKGGIIEWGFDPRELTDDAGQTKDMQTQDFYGISMGPRDIEVVVEE
jgi:hypothetical protein